jgi:hypothetical protein
MNGADMPRPRDMPNGLQEIPFLNATPIRAGKDFHTDMNLVQETIKRICAQV